MRYLALGIFILVSQWGSAWGFAQVAEFCDFSGANSGFFLYFDTQEVAPSGATIQVRCMMDNIASVGAWSFAVCENEFSDHYDLSAAEHGQAVISGNGGATAEFSELHVCPGEGILQAVIIDNAWETTLPGWTGWELCVIDVDLSGPAGTFSTIRYCDTGFSCFTTVAETLVESNGSFIVPEQIPGMIQINAPEEAEPSDCNENGLVDMCEIALGAADINSNGILDECEGLPFIRGDVNEDQQLDLADAISILGFMFSGGILSCEKSADSNDDGHLNVADAITLISTLFTGGPPPPSPGPASCSLDPTPDALDCQSYDGC